MSSGQGPWPWRRQAYAAVRGQEQRRHSRRPHSRPRGPRSEGLFRKAGLLEPGSRSAWRARRPWGPANRGDHGPESLADGLLQVCPVGSRRGVTHAQSPQVALTWGYAPAYGSGEPSPRHFLSSQRRTPLCTCVCVCVCVLGCAQLPRPQRKCSSLQAGLSHRCPPPRGVGAGMHEPASPALCSF